ncbi:MAG: PEGA domain-containing protein [bacterium]|nr:PEGA domain-containing protein [bacterium]
MREKSIIISLLLFLAISLQPFFVSPAKAAEKGSLAIDPLKTNLVDKKLLAAISSYVREYIASSDQYEIVEKGAALKKGGGLLLEGSLVKLGTKFIVNLRLLDLDMGGILKEARGSTAEEELLKSLENTVSSLLGISGFARNGTNGLSEGFGFLHLKSDPPGATIMLDGRDAGITPCTIESLKSGKHVVKLIKDDYFIWKKEIEIAGGSVINIMAELKTIYGSLDFNSSPSGASVFIEGDLVGQTPFKVDNLEGGEYEIEIELEGYEDYSDTVQVDSGSGNEISIFLEETEAHREYRLARKRIIKKRFWAFGALALSGITAVKAYVDYSDSEDAYSSADDAYIKYQNSQDPVEIADYRRLTESYKEEGASRAEDGDSALILSSALLAFSIYNFYTMPPKAEYGETAFIMPEIRRDVMFLAWKKRY